MPHKEATSLCKTILRNGYDAYIINAPLQDEIYTATGKQEMDIACEPGFEVLGKFIQNLEHSNEDGVMAVLQSESGWLYRFYSSNVADSALPELALTRITQHMKAALHDFAPERYIAVTGGHAVMTSANIFEDRACGIIKLVGIPQITLARDYSIAIKALRLAANYDLPIDPATWVAIIQSTNRIADYVPAREFVAEWRQVAAENMWRFFKLLFDSSILHALLPEVAALGAMRQNRSKQDNDEESILEHTLTTMRHYPEENLHYDWIGTASILFQNIGKLYTAEYFEERWSFFQHHRVGAKVTRKILRRLHFDQEDIDTICSLIRNQMRFHSMLTDRGIRRFLELPDQERLIEIARAHIKAQNGSYTNFNHNKKYLERGDTPEQMLEPLLNGNEIMEFTGLPQGPAVGQIRQALLQAQIEGKVKNMNDAVAFVRQSAPKS